MKTMTSMCLMLAGCSLASAKIGDTKDECRTRYHDPAAPAPRFDNLFSRRGVNTDCLFDPEGKCVNVSYRILYVATGGDSKEPRFDGEQVKKLLAINAGASEWEKKSDDSFGAPWDGTYVTKDGTRQAKVNPTGVTVTLVAFWEKEKELVRPEAVEAVIESFGK